MSSSSPKEVAGTGRLLYINNVKRECLSLLLAALAVNMPAATNPPSDSEKKAIDLLRETIYQYERRRGVLLPAPTLSTNAARRTTNTTVANVPSKPIPWTGVPPVANVPPSRFPAPGVTNRMTSPSEGTAPAHETTLAELERLYLDGKITAKQFQKYLQQHEQQQQTAAARTPEPAPATVAVRPSPPVKQAPPPKTVSPSARRAPPPAATASPDQTAISEVERKMDELIQAKALRDQQATNALNTATNAAAVTGPKTQRQKLDDLLRFYIEGKVSDAEYKERREKILAEPNPK
jgi:hypothetical protein